MSSNFRYDGRVQSVVGQAITGAQIAVLTQPANVNTQPGSPLAALFAAALSNSAVAITSASWALGQITFNFTATPPVDVVPGAFLAATGFVPTGFNGVWQVVSVVGNAVTVTTPYTLVAIANPGAFVGAGTVNTSALPNPFPSDNLGNFAFYAAAGTYTVQIYDTLGRLVKQLVLADQVVVAGGAGAGSVTSVALTMPAEFTVGGSPIVGAGTLAVTKATQNANLVFAGPTSGGAATPGFRAIVAADLTGVAGTVTSVALTLAVPSIFGQTVTGTPITTNGTLALTLTLNNQNANLFFAGATSGGAAQPSFRAIVPADVPFSPNIVNETDLTAQAAAIAATTLYAVPAAGAGKYRISYVAKVTTPATTSSTLGGAAGFQAVYTDKDDSVVVTTPAWWGGGNNGAAPTSAALNTTQTVVSGEIIVNAKASTNIQFSFGYTSVGGTVMGYSLHVTTELI